MCGTHSQSEQRGKVPLPGRNPPSGPQPSQLQTTEFFFWKVTAAYKFNKFPIFLWNPEAHH